ncbi:MAG: hypothetical protein IPM25_07925 [Chloracidobacterium sp.]|nr:hypothetical protein [Chloracidobacterium sp.]
MNGPFAGQDPDNTCRKGPAIVTEISPAYVKKWDAVVGIKIDVNGLAEHFKPKIEFLEKTEAIEVALKACDYVKVKKLVTEISQITPKDDLMKKWENEKLPGIKLQVDAFERARESIKRAESAESSGNLEDAIRELDMALYQPGFPDCPKGDLKKAPARKVSR